MDFHIETSGAGPAILFLHAGVADSRMWRDQMNLTGYRSVVFDQRGFGQTPWTPEVYSNREDALGVLDTLGIESATIVGCSIGGGTALELAIENPGRVDGLVLVGAYPSGWVPEGGFEENPLEDEAEAASKAGDYDRVIEIDLQMWLIGYGRTGDGIDPSHQELFRDMDRTPVRNEAERNEYVERYEGKLNDRLNMIEVPTLVVVGEYDESPLVDAAHHLASKLSNRPPIVVDDAAHLPSLEQPEAFNTALLAFLDS